MKRWIQLTGAVGLAVSVTACAGDKSPDATTGTGAAVGTSGTMAADAEFVEEQLAMGTAEIELGRLAQERGTHADVKEFGAMMVSHHQMAADELKPIADKVKAGQTTARTGERDEYQDKLEDLSKLSGHDFDKKYIEEMVDDHQEGVKDLENRAENAADPDVKQWAARTLPKMREHLERAKDIQTRLNNADAQPGGYDRK